MVNRAHSELIEESERKRKLGQLWQNNKLFLKKNDDAMPIKKPNSTSPLIMLIADGIHNSVFVSQVLEPLIKRAGDRSIILISCERPMPITVPAELHDFTGELELIPRLPYLGTISLIPTAIKLRHILKNYQEYELIARGPIAGWLALRAIDEQCASLIIQARGLMAEEYRLARASDSGLKKLITKIRTHQFLHLEHSVYGTKKSNVSIEAVSEAMGEYLCKEFCTNPNRITIAEIDKPPSIAVDQKKKWRSDVRAELNIPADAKVWCYNGSAKAWQCPEESVSFLAKKLAENQKHFALILTPDPDIFEELFEQFLVDKLRYRILKVPARETFKYLASADAGIVFRAASPVNWVSRPTKVLEYRALGLDVIHNNTIAWLRDT